MAEGLSQTILTPITWIRLPGFNFNPNPLVYPSQSTWANYTTTTIDACETICNQGPGCDFYTYNSASRVCDLKFADLVANMSTVFKGQTSGQVFGELRFANIINDNPIVTASADECVSQCSATAACQFVIYDETIPTAVLCTMKFFDADPTTTIGFRQNPRPLNYNPTVLGRVDVIGNSGIVCIFANLLPDGGSCAALDQNTSEEASTTTTSWLRSQTQTFRAVYMMCPLERSRPSSTL